MNEVKNVYQKLQILRKQLSEAKITKSGKNTYSNFNYFELSDFLPTVNIACEKIGLCGMFNIKKENEQLPTGEIVSEEIAELVIYNTENPAELVRFATGTAEAIVKGATPIQILGSKITYLRRYLWLVALELSEHDVQDEVTGKDKETGSKQAEKKATNLPTITGEQLEQIKALYSDQELQAICTRLNIKSVEEMDVAQATKAIKFKAKEGK